MSSEYTVHFEIRDMLIMKNALEQMGYNYQELGNEHLAVKTSTFRDIIVDGNAGTITCNDSLKAEADKIKQGYMVEFYRENAIQEGNQIHMEEQTDGSIDIYLSH